MYMITDSLTCRSQEKPRRSGAPLVCRAGNVGVPQSSAAAAIASRWSRRSVLTASRACHKSTLAMVIDALASALVAPTRARGRAAAIRKEEAAHPPNSNDWPRVGG